MDDITKRRIEGLIGIYSHPDVTKFILTVLHNFETPVHEQYLKKNILTNNILKNNFIPNTQQNNTFNFLPNTQQNNTFSFLPNNNATNSFIPNNNVTNSFIPNNVTNTVTNSFIPNNNVTNTVTNSFIPNNLTNTVTNSFIPNNVTNTVTNSFIPNTQQNNANLIIDINNMFLFTKEIIEKKTELKLKCSIANNCSDDNIIFISKKNGDNDVILPKEYKWNENEKNILNDHFINIINFKNISNYNDEYTMNLFIKTHNFILSFEKLLTNNLIPCLNNEKYSKLINNEIIESITVPVLIAFEQEFNNSPYSLMLNLQNNKLLDNYNKYIENLCFNKEEILKIIGSDKQIDFLLYHIYRNAQLVDYFIKNYN
jgi:hypothetical protein